MGFACDDEHKRTPPGGISGGGACEAKPGELPTPDCDNSQKACASSPGCVIDQARCGSTSTCLPIGDNKGKDVLDFRFRRLNIAAPAALSAPFIQNIVVNAGIDLDDKACAESGKGLFSWIMRVDKSAQTILTGGAPPSSDPLGAGFCFARFTTAQGTTVAPVTIPIETVGGTFKTTTLANVNIPIFLSEELSSAIVLPIRDARIEGVTISSDGNCVGRFNAIALDPSCAEDRDLCPKWTTAGALGGFITLEEADSVTILDLNNKSLCAFLASESGLVCARDATGKIQFAGDYCSTDKHPASCRDSVWLAATFAASAANITDGATIAACSAQPTPPTDASTSDASDASNAPDASDASDQ